jgi:hypothetical protein
MVNTHHLGYEKLLNYWCIRNILWLFREPYTARKSHLSKWYYNYQFNSWNSSFAIERKVSLKFAVFFSCEILGFWVVPLFTEWGERNSFCGQSVEFLKVKSGGAWSPEVTFSLLWEYLFCFFFFFSRLYNPSVFRSAQLSLRILSRKVLQCAVANGTSHPQLGGELVLFTSANCSFQQWKY